MAKKESANSLATMGQRIRYAREWHHWEARDLRAALEKTGISLSRQQLSNYENIESTNPALAILEGIGNVTGFNPGWLAFNTGPVFAIDPLVQLIRAANARSLFKGSIRERSLRSALKSRAIDPARVDACLAMPLINPIDDAMARAIEKVSAKPVGWLDAQPQDRRRQAKKDMTILIEALHFAGAAIRLPAQQRHALLTVIKAFQQDMVPGGKA